ncbi:hypothetical protein GYMLUDRAFT_236808 [Collybiopsis luxurians FD-317 M1]|nr:hypothetical protein GYMLUDRAFT_236808 [Collybiopsis luxurians FD-317 M1]
MLPEPVPYAKRRAAFSNRRTLDQLWSRARITNLGVLLLVALAFISLLINFRLLAVSSVPHSSIFSTLGRTGELADLDHLILVPGHAIWNGPSVDYRLDENMWTLEPYQRNGGRLEAFYQHIAHAARLSLQDKHSLLVFSGGQTHRATTTTEAESYLRLALQSDLLPHDFARVTTENYALDSFQNLLFSIARFHEYTGVYPATITVVGYEMKRKRFTDLHRVAIRWPMHQFEYIGIDSDDVAEAIVARDGENAFGYIPYAKDLYGCHSELLRKRRSRNPHSRFHPYHTSSSEISTLMEWCPTDADTLYNGILPWDLN